MAFTETFRHPAPALQVQLDLADTFIDGDIHSSKRFPTDDTIINQPVPHLEILDRRDRFLAVDPGRDIRFCQVTRLQEKLFNFRDTGVTITWPQR